MSRIDAPSDGTTTHVAPGDFVRVLATDEVDQRADLLFDDPLDLDEEVLGPQYATFVKQYGGGRWRLGPNLRWPKALPAYLDMTGSAGPSGYDFAAEPETLTWDVNGTDVDVELGRDYLTEAEGDESLAALLLLVDVLSQLPGVTVRADFRDDRDESVHDFVFATVLEGDAASLAVVDVPEPTKTGVVLQTGVDGTTVDMGVESRHGSGGVYTHGWPDNVESYHQRCTIYPDVLLDGDGNVIERGWYALDYPVRGEHLKVQDWTVEGHPVEQLNVALHNIVDRIDTPA